MNEKKNTIEWSHQTSYICFYRILFIYSNFIYFQILFIFEFYLFILSDFLYYIRLLLFALRPLTISTFSNTAPASVVKKTCFLFLVFYFNKKRFFIKKKMTFLYSNNTSPSVFLGESVLGSTYAIPSLVDSSVVTIQRASPSVPLLEGPVNRPKGDNRRFSNDGEFSQEPRTTVSQNVQTRFSVQLAFAKFLSKIKGNF